MIKGEEEYIVERTGKCLPPDEENAGTQCRIHADSLEACRKKFRFSLDGLMLQASALSPSSRVRYSLGVKPCVFLKTKLK